MNEQSTAAKEARREYRRKYDSENRAKINKYQRKWRKANPDKVKAIHARYWERVAKKNEEV